MRLNYFTAQASKPKATGVKDLGLIFPEQTHSQSWYDVRSMSRQRPASMQVFLA